MRITSVSLVLLILLGMQNGCADPTGGEDLSEDAEATGAVKVLVQAAVGQMGEFEISPYRVADGKAKLKVWLDRRNGYSYITDVERGNLLPIGGRLYRVVELVENEKTRDEVHLNLDPTELDGISLRADGFVIPLGGRGWINTVRMELGKIELPEDAKDSHVAHLSLWPDEYRTKEYAKREGAEISKRTVRPGDVVLLGDKRHKVLKIVPANSKQGLLGWVEFDSRPLVSQ